MVPLCWLGIAIFAVCLAKSASADSFQSQFTSPIYYGLAVAGISLAAAVGAALFGLLIFCLVRRRQKEDLKLAKSDTEASTMSSQQQQQQQQKAKQLRNLGTGGGGGGGGVYGPMALPPVASTINSAGSNGKTSSAGGASGSRTSLDAAAGRVHTTAGVGGSSGSGGNGLYRHSSFLRPVSYTASLESSKSRSGAGGPDQHQHQHQPVITHAAVRTSPAATLDPRYFLSQGAGINQHQLDHNSNKRLSIAEQLPQQQHQKRLSYAEQRAQYGSGGGSAVELVSGQVFASSTSSIQRPASSSQPHNKQPQPQQQKPVSRLPSSALPPQPEEATALAEGPRFPKTTTSRTPSKQQQQQPQPQPQPQPLPESPQESPQRPHQSLHRIHLGGGGGEDGRSVASTVLKQEAMKAFDFLEGYEDAN